MSRLSKWVSTRNRSFPHRSHLIRMSHDRNAANGSCIASAPGGSASPKLCPVGPGGLRPAIACGPAHDFSKQLDSGITSTLVLLGVEVLHRAEKTRRGLA